MKVTQKEIAERLGVSQSLVSRALSGKDNTIGASEETMKRIRGLAEELDYVHNVAARTLRGGPSHTLGVAVLDFEDPYFGRVLANVHHLASEAGFSLVVTGSERRGIPRAGLQQLLRHEIDGLLVVGSQPHDDWTHPFVATSLPIVQIGHGQRAKGMRRVAVHDEIGADGLLAHLYESGHRTVGFIATDTWGHQRRLRVFERQAKKHGMDVQPEWIAVHEGLHAEAGVKAMKALLQAAGGNRPTAIMAIDDELAQGALRALADEGISVPGDVSLTGFDDILAAALMVPALTTVRQPVEELARRALDLVTNVDHFWSAHQDTILIPPAVCIRESTSVAAGPAAGPLS